MPHPFQCIATVKPGDGPGQYLLAACGPTLLSVQLNEGTVVSQWPAEGEALPAAPHDDQNGEDNVDERPAKKQKTAPSSRTKPNMIKLTVSQDGHYAVVVTDDKCVRVFSIDPSGILTELSQRYMPKRPCAIHVLPDNATVMVADKFGDVYSLPLLQKVVEDQTEASDAGAEKEATPQPNKPVFKPSATTLTVHSKRNRDALEAQMKQKNFSERKEALKFEHKLLLGHVSMLTDALYATREVNGKQRGYIITADRDEHIRVSRGPPQSHIIQGFCLGHTDFVSKLCLIQETNILISGGGDSWLGVWRWSDFKLTRKLEIGCLIDTAQSTEKTSEAGLEVSGLAVYGLWTAPFTNEEGKQETALLVALEKRPALFVVPVSRLLDEGSRAITELTLSHPVLDVICVDDTVIIAQDGRTDGQTPLLAYKLHQISTPDGARIKPVFDEDMLAKLKCISHRPGAADDVTDKALDELLYGVANLRKRRGWDAPPDGNSKDTTAGDVEEEE